MEILGNITVVPGGVALNGERQYLDGGDFHGKCICDPEKCTKGVAVAFQVIHAIHIYCPIYENSKTSKLFVIVLVYSPSIEAVIYSFVLVRIFLDLFA